MSVVVPSYQSARHIRNALRALLDQETDLPYEILVVDSSIDGTDDLVRREFPTVRLLHYAHRCSAGTARNLGVQAAAGEVILFTDTDTTPCPTWLHQMVSAMRETGAAGVGGSMANGTPWSVTGSAGFFLEFFRFIKYRGRPHVARFLVGGNSGFRRDVLRQFQYEDESAGEDMILSARVARDGGAIFFLPEASVRHHNRTGFLTLLQYQRHLGRNAFRYRSEVGPRGLGLLRVAPALVFLAPLGVMPWIAWCLLVRRLVPDLVRFLMILPVCVIGNAAWAFGFYEAQRQAATRA